MEYGLFGLIILALDIYALIKTWGSGAGAGSKIIWTLLILFLPVLGLILWFFLGPRGNAVRV